MTKGTRIDSMGHCEMNGWLSRGHIRRKKSYYRLHGPFLSEHENEVSDTGNGLDGDGSRGADECTRPGRRSPIDFNPSRKRRVMMRCGS